MRSKMTCALLTACLVAPAAFAGSITGTITYDGKVPNLPPLRMAADPGCSKKHTTPPKSEMLVLGAGNTMANIFVQVKNPPAGNHAAPSTPAVIDQDGCKYVPHVLGVMKGQKITVKNSDGLLHNVHALPKVNKEFNTAMPASRTETEVVFDKEEGMFKIKCDVHPWMGAWVSVMSHPYFAVTGTDGKFEIKGLAAGSYEVEAWHEKLPAQKGSVTVAADGAATLDFSFAPPSK